MSEREPDFTKPEDVYAFLDNEFGMCGCSDTADVVSELCRVLEWCDSIMEREQYFSLYKDDGIYYLIMGMCDSAGLVEHGTSIRSPWLTDLGKQFLKALSAFTIEELENPSCEAYDECWHGLPKDKEDAE